MSIFILDSVLSYSDVIKAIVLMLVIHAYFLLFKSNPPYDHIYLNRAERFCSLAYMIVLTMIFIRMSTDSDLIRKLCQVLIIVSIAGAGGYVRLNVFWLYVRELGRVLEKIIENKRNRRPWREIFNSLRNYHDNERY